jgi:hypothetical protein
MPIPGSRSVIVKVTRGNLLAKRVAVLMAFDKEQLPGVRLPVDRRWHGGLAAFKARVLLMANTAGFCGLVLSRAIETELAGAI